MPVRGSHQIVLPNAFVLTDVGMPKLETNLVVPGVVSPGFPVKQTLWVEYRNTGDVPMPAPLLQVVGDGNALLTANEDVANALRRQTGVPSGLTNSVQILGIGSGATPGYLQPGESGRIPVYYVGLSHDNGAGAVTFSLGSLTTLDTTEKVVYLPPDVKDTTGAIGMIGIGGGSGYPPGIILTDPSTYQRVVFERPRTGGTTDVNKPLFPGRAAAYEEYLTLDWSTVYSQLRPPTIPTDAWEAILYNLRASYGDLWAGYVGEMAANADYLGGVGQATSDLGALWGFEIARASAALSPIQSLAGAVDAAAPAPGLPMVFSRVYGEDLVSRFRVGSLGRGWTTNWDVWAETDQSGDVILHGPGGVDRFFTRNGDGSYTPSAGDHGKLTSSGGVFSLLETDGTVWQFRSDGKLDSVADTNGNRITLGYIGNSLRSITHSNGRQFLMDYDANGRLIRLTDTMGPGSSDDRVTTYAYDASDEQLIRVTAPGNRVTSYDYTPVSAVQFNPTGPRGDTHYFDHQFPDPRSHALRSVTYPDGSHDYVGYDTRGRLVETKRDGDAERVTFSYDSTGGVTVTDATGQKTTLDFGLGGQLVQVRDGAGRIVRYGYDAQSQLKTLVGPGGETYRYGYDAQGNLTGISDALNLQTAFSYEPNFNHLSSFTDPRGNGIQYGYDSHGNLTATTYADGSKETYTYDASGDVLTATNRRGQVETFTYDAAGQVLTKDESTTPGIDDTYTYDTAGNLTSATDATGTTRMTYAPQTDLLMRIDYPGGHWIAFTYDAVGRRKSRTDESGYVVHYSYDAIGRLATMTDTAGSLIVHYEYDAAGRLSKKTLGNGVYTTYEYDAAGNITHLVNLRSDGTILSRYNYTYDISGRRSSMTTLDGTFSYGYDALGQLARVTYPDGHVVTYDYDAAGNRIRVIDNGVETDYTTNALNQYTQVGGVTYGFDADGNMVSKTEDGAKTTYTYDIENRLVSVNTPTDTRNYAYDALGDRVATTHAGTTTTNVIDPVGLGNLAAEYDGNSQLIARYNYGYGLLSRTDTSGQATFYTFSAIGSTSEVTGSSGAVLDAYTYDPFGASLGKTETVPNPFDFVGEFGVINEGDGLVFMRSRYYGQTLGRFLQNDPIGITSDSNPYRYASNDSNNFVDPSVLFLDDNRLTRPRLDPGIPGGDGKPVYYQPDPEANHVIHSIGLGIAGAVGIGIGIIYVGPWLLTFEATNPDLYQFLLGVATATIAELTNSKLPPNLLVPKERIAPGLNWTAFKDLSAIDWPSFEPRHFSSWIPRYHSIDPNDKLAPAGFSNSAVVQSGQSLAYQILFENKPEATAPAQRILITDTLDPNLDLDTFELTEIAFADQRIVVPPGLDHYEATLPVKANGVDLLVLVNAALDRASRNFSLNLQAIYATTGWVPENPLLGLLYPDDATGRGQGSISYRVKPLVGLPSGIRIENRASIVFDYNDPIDTPLVHNTLDAGTPTSQVTALPASTTAPSFTLSWSGEDEANGSGIASYDIYVSIDGGAPFPWLVDTTLTSATFTGVPGQSYAFYSIARDNVGHVEAAPATPDTMTKILVTTTVHAGPDQTANEGDTVGLSGASYTSLDDASHLSLIINWGDGSVEMGTLVPGTNGGKIANTHRYADNGTYTITLTLSDSSGTPVQDSAQVTVLNVAPTATMINGGPVNEGSTGSVTLISPLDPSTADTAAGFRYSFDFNNDGTFEVVNSLSPSAIVPAAYLADGPSTRTIHARMADKDGGSTDYTTTITVRDVTPSVSVGDGLTTGIGTTFTRVGSFTDPGTDTWTASVDYGDGAGVQPLPLNPDKTFVLNHTYSRSGSFAVAVWVADKDGAVGLGSFSVYVLPLPVTVSSLRVATVKVGTGKKAKNTTGLVLQFSGALNPAQAQSLGSYQLVMAGRDKKFGTRDDKGVKLASATYNASTHTVTLIPKQAFNKTQLQQLRVKSAFLTDSFGRPLDGNHDGVPGGDFVATLKGKSVTILSAPQAQAVSHNITAMAVDVLMQDPGLILSPSSLLPRRRVRVPRQ